MTARMATHLSITALSVLSAALLLAAPAWSAPSPAQSDIAFTFRQMGVPVDGHFKKFDAQLAFDPKNAAAGKVTLSIELGSATLGDAATDAELVKPEWFNVKKVPTATFQSTAIKALGGGKFEATGKLTIKGQVKDVVVPVALAQAGGTTTATGAFAIKRLDFNIGEGEWKDTAMVANDVQVKFKLVITGMAPL